jgi:hypothetical protein
VRIKLFRNIWDICHLLPRSCAHNLLYINVNSKWFDIAFNFIIKLEDLKIQRFENGTTIDFKLSLLRGKVIGWIN